MKRFLQILFVTILAFCLPLSGIFADASNVSQDQVDFSLNLTEEDGVVSSEVKIVNNSGKELKNLRIETGVPDGLSIPDDLPNVMTKESLPAGKALTTVLSYNPVEPEEVEETDTVENTKPEEKSAEDVKSADEAGEKASAADQAKSEEKAEAVDSAKAAGSAQVTSEASEKVSEAKEETASVTKEEQAQASEEQQSEDKTASPSVKAASASVVETPKADTPDKAQTSVVKSASTQDQTESVKTAGASAKVTQASEENVKTGSETAMTGLFIALALMFFITLLIFTAKKKRGSSAGMLLSVALAALLMQGAIPAVKAADTERGITLEKTITVAGRDYTVMANINYVIDTDESGLPTDAEDQGGASDEKTDNKAGDPEVKDDLKDTGNGKADESKADESKTDSKDEEADVKADQSPGKKDADVSSTDSASSKAEDASKNDTSDKKDGAEDQSSDVKDSSEEKKDDASNETGSTSEKESPGKDTSEKDAPGASGSASEDREEDKSEKDEGASPSKTEEPKDDSGEKSSEEDKTSSEDKEESPAPVEKTFTVRITADGEVKTVTLKKGQTAADAIKAADITLSKDDTLSEDPDQVITADTELTVSRVSYKEVKKTETILYGTYEEDDDSIETGTTKVVQKGENGTKDVVYLEKYVDGVKTETTVKSETVTKKMVSEKIKIGTGPVKPKDITADGAKMIFSTGGNGWIWPIDGNAPGHFTVTSIMGTRESPGGIGSTNHMGTDIAANTNSKILAVADGTVIQAGPNGGYGNSVTITTPQGYTVLYGHLNSVAVSKGQTVKQGDTVGYEGSTGNSTGPHLHFEVRNAAGQAVNGLQFYGQDILSQLYYCD